MTDDGAALRALLAMRWAMVRDARTRMTILVVLGAVLGLLVGVVVLALTLPRPAGLGLPHRALLVLPSAETAFLVLASVGPLVAGGGSQLFADGELDAFPVTAGTTYLASLVLTPLNVAWVGQVLALVFLTTYAGDRKPTTVLMLVTTLVWVLVSTLFGLAVAWLVNALRRSARGRLLTWASGLAGIAYLGWLTAHGRVIAAADSSAVSRRLTGTYNDVKNLTQPGHAGVNALVDWVVRVMALLIIGTLLFYVGIICCRWAVHRSGDSGTSRDGKPVRRRAARRSPLAELVAVDLASVWRSRPLRRGVLTVCLLPAAIAFGSHLPWRYLVLIPSLVCSGAALLFGINAFCLDAGGAVWVASLPYRARDLFWSKAITVTGVNAGATLAAVAAGAAHAAGPLTPATLAALVCCCLALVVHVSATCMEWSVRSPRQALLQGNRETAVPPATMAAYSARLAIGTTATGLLFYLAAWSGDVRSAVALLGVYVLLAARRTLRSWRVWAQPAARARVVAAVAAG